MIFKIFGPWLFKWFLRIGKVFYPKIAIRGDGKAAHFAASEWDMCDSMKGYLEEEDYITNDKPNNQTEAQDTYGLN
jgi:hypothetical protein